MGNRQQTQFAFVLALVMFVSSHNSGVAQKHLGHEFHSYSSYKFSEQDTLSPQRNSERRDYFLYTGIGFLEFLVLGLGHQINDDWALAGKVNAVFLSGGFIGPNGQPGVGIRLSRFLKEDFLFFNVIHIEPSYLSEFFGPSRGEVQGFSFQLTVGGESVDKRGIHSLWSLGGVVSTGTGSPPLFMLSAKIGLNWNF